MVDAAIPDLNRIDLILPETITALTGIPWTWGVTHGAGGVLFFALIVTLLVANQHRKPVFGLLCVGIVSHFIIDYSLWQPTGTTNLMLWPFLDLSVDSQGFYRSSDRWPAAVATIITGIVIGNDRIVITEQSKELDDGSPAD